MKVENTCPNAEETAARNNDVEVNWIKCKLTEQGCVCSYMLPMKFKYVMNGNYTVCPGYVMNGSK